MNNVPQPRYRDGTYAWAVDAIRPGGSQGRITTTYVKAPTAKRAAKAGRHRLRSLIKARGYKGGWRAHARPAHAVHDLGMQPTHRATQTDCHQAPVAKRVTAGTSPGAHDQVNGGSR